MIKVLIVDDSSTVSQVLEYILGEDPGIEVVGVARDGLQALKFVEENKPDIITMDIDMPNMNGLEATRRIMASTPIPIIMVTASRNANDKKVGIEALASGALSIVNKPVGFSSVNEMEKSHTLLKLVKIYSQVKVIKRVYRPKEEEEQAIATAKKPKMGSFPMAQFKNRKYVTVGVSSGGPTVLAEVFSKITKDFPYPVMVVQHITAGFLDSMIAWLNRLLVVPVKIAEHGEVLKPGVIYFAPDNYQACISLNRVELSSDPEIRICPSVEHLFKRQAEYYGNDTIAIMLTGMGSDGAAEMKTLRDRGAVTIAQDEASALVYGMPGEAVKFGAVEHVLTPGQIAELLSSIETSKK